MTRSHPSLSGLCSLTIVVSLLAGWYDYLLTQEVTMKSSGFSPKEGSPHGGFVAVDPEGYFVEFDEFFEAEGNEALLAILETGS